MSTFDGIIIGGGHNGLTCAAYLARAGLRVAVVERNPEVGGGCSTEEVTVPGFRHNLHSNFHFFEDGPVGRDLQLERYGLCYLYPDVQSAAVFRDGTAITLHRDPHKTASSFARFSAHDAQTYLELHEKFAVKTAELMRRFLFTQPLTPVELMARVHGKLLWELAGYSRKTLYEPIEQHFENERVRLLFKLTLHSGGFENLPYMGLALPRLISLIFRAGLAIGGSMALPRALVAIVEEHGGVVLRRAHVERILVENDRAVGVRLASGEWLRATQFVASGIDAPQTMRLAGEERFGGKISKKLKQYEPAAHSLVTLHLALNDAPHYTASAFDPDVDQAFVTAFGVETSAELDETMAAIYRGELPKRFAGISGCNSRFDPLMAPPGKHSAFWWPMAPYALRDGGAAAWDTRKAEIGERLLEEWRAFAPNLTAENVLGSYVFSPLDIERTCINMVGGSHHVGRYTADQFGSNRPIPELGGYRTPVKRLYLCGSSSHPGGSVSGGPGYICANKISEDLGVSKWWTPMEAPAWEEYATQAL